MTGGSWASDSSAGYISEIEGTDDPPPSYPQCVLHEKHNPPLSNLSAMQQGGNPEDPGLRFYKPRRENKCLLILVMFVAFAFMILFSVFFGLHVRDEYEKAYQTKPEIQNTTALTTFTTTMFIEVPITLFKTQSMTFTPITTLQTTVPTTTTKTTTVTETIELVTIRPSSVSVCWNLLWSICSGHATAGDQED
jgi:hypothetical protein